LTRWAIPSKRVPVIAGGFVAILFPFRCSFVRSFQRYFCGAGDVSHRSGTSQVPIRNKSEVKMIREAIKSIVKTPGKAPPTGECALAAQIEARAAEAAASLEQARTAYAEAALAAAEGQAVDLASVRATVEAARDALQDAQAALSAARTRQAKVDAERAAKARTAQIKSIKAAAQSRIKAVKALHEVAEQYAAKHADYMAACAALADALAPTGIRDKFVERLSTHFCELRPKMDLRYLGVVSAFKLPLTSFHYVPFVDELTADTEAMVEAVQKLETTR
jgi:hypothetical protein